MAIMLSITVHAAEDQTSDLKTIPPADLDPDVVKIAVIDTGFDVKGKWNYFFKTPPRICDKVDFTHMKIGNNLKLTESDDVTDEHGHGTHIAGVIGQFAGEAPHCFYIYKYYNAKGNDQDNLTNTQKSIRRAIDKNVDIINYSGGGIARSDIECNLVKEALDKGIIFVAAAGNERSDITVHPYWPAMCDPRVIAVTALHKSGKGLLDTSNKTSRPDLVRLDEEIGEDVLSTLPDLLSPMKDHDGQYGYMTGTSQAAATMSGKLANHLYIMRKSHYGRFLLKKASGWGK